MEVRGLMTPISGRVGANETVRLAAYQMAVRNVGVLPVYDGDVRVGLITDRDIARQCVAKGLDPDSCSVKDCVQENPICIEAEQDIGAALRVMGQEHVRRLGVVENGQLVGTIEVGDIAMQALEVSSLGQGPY